MDRQTEQMVDQYIKTLSPLEKEMIFGKPQRTQIVRAAPMASSPRKPIRQKPLPRR